QMNEAPVPVPRASKSVGDLTKAKALSLTLPIPSTFNSNDGAVVFKNDQIFKIKAIEPYLAPPFLTSHLSFRKGQAF
ncbi:UNVERIFIED_CONTAM: hypothetical protein HDU68_004852, partial [Siphonaria sp. JEL0065]